MKFIGYKWLWLTKDFGTKDISFGIHICWKGRIDIHFWTSMLSIGRVPIYMYADRCGEWKTIAVGNSYHKDKLNYRRNCRPIRAGFHKITEPAASGTGTISGTGTKYNDAKNL